MNNKKGFTLIEIIVCIALITTISITTSIIVFNKNKNEQTLLEKYSNSFKNALEVYLSDNNEITYNIKNNAKAAVVTLEVLKNEGLIEKNIKGIDYKNNYFLLSNALLLDEKNTNTDCENDVISVEVFAKWDLEKNANGKKVIYVCPKNSSSEKSLNNYIAVGKNPNNYIKIEDKLWRIIESSNNGIYVITTNKDDLISYNKYTENMDISSYYYANYATPLEYVNEGGADNGHNGLDVGAFYSNENNIGILNYTSIMNTTTVSGNWLIELYSNFKETIYASPARFSPPSNENQKFGSFHTAAYADYEEKANWKIVPYIRLKECYIITNGTGTENAPYELSNKCS